MFKITCVKVLHLTGADQLHCLTDLPPLVHPYGEPASLTIHVARGEGLDYALKHFPGVRVEYITETSSEVAREGDPVHDPYADLDFQAGDRYTSATG